MKQYLRHLRSHRSPRSPASSSSLPLSVDPPLSAKRIDFSSLQLRLTLGLTAGSIVGLGGVAAWTGWEMQQILIISRTDNVRYIGERFPQDVAASTVSRPPTATDIQRAIDAVSAPNLLIWVRGRQGDLVAQSAPLRTAPIKMVDRLFRVAEMPLKPEVYRIDQHFFVLCSVPLVMEGQSLGQLYIAQDITAEQRTLMLAIKGLGVVTLLITALLAIGMAIYIRRSLRPLRNMSQMAATISAHTLNQVQLTLQDAPTEVTELAETLNEMLMRLGRSWEQQQQLIGNVSHELRTPLSLVSGYLQSLRRRGQNLSEAQQAMLEAAITETESIVQVLNDLLDTARADNSSVGLHPEKLELKQLVTDVIKLEEQVRQREIQMETTVEAIWITTDRSGLCQALTHLIDNAVHYSPPEQPIVVRLQIVAPSSVDAAHPAQAIQIQVCDRGCGIPLQQQPYIFDRFYRVDEARNRNTGGVGLGLSLAKTWVENLGGRLTVQSTLGQGSTFTITLPFEESLSSASV